MKRLFVLLLIQFFFIGIFAQTAAQMSFSALNSDGIRGLDENIQAFREIHGYEDAHDTILIDKLNKISLSFVYDNKLFVLAYGDFDEAPIKSRGIYLFRKDDDGWRIASDRIFTATYVEGKLVDEYIMNPTYSNECTEVLDNGNVLMLVRNRIWVTGTKSDFGYFGSFLNFLILKPASKNNFKYNLWTTKNKFDFFPDGVDVKLGETDRKNSSYNIVKNENDVTISSAERYVKFMFDGNKMWESNPDNVLIRLK